MRSISGAFVMLPNDSNGCEGWQNPEIKTKPNHCSQLILIYTVEINKDVDSPSAVNVGLIKEWPGGWQLKPTQMK